MKKTRAKRVLLRAGLIIAGLAVVGGLGWWLVPRSGYLHLLPQRIDWVTVEGHAVLDGREVLDASGLRPGTQMNPQAKHAALDRLEGHELIADARLNWWQGELEVEITERSPLAYAKIGNAHYLITVGAKDRPASYRVENKDLIAGYPETSQRLKRLPLIVLEDPALRDDGGALRNSFQLAYLLRPERHAQVRYLRVSADRRYVVELNDGSQIALGEWRGNIAERAVRGIEVWRRKRTEMDGGPLHVELTPGSDTAYVNLLRRE